jgi:hypothetical protein
MMVRGSFNQGAVPIIAVINKAKTPLGVDVDKLIAAMQIYIDSYIVPVWGTPAKLVKSKTYIKNAWAIVFYDNADQEGALAYHDLTSGGLPLSKVFVKTTIDDGEFVSVSTSHELVEMLVDPAINMLSTGVDEKTLYAYESADPVESTSFKISGIEMSNFVYPSYFEIFRKAKSVKFDQLGVLVRPLQVAKGGYQITLKDGKWDQVFGSQEKRYKFSQEDRRGHRSEIRAKVLEHWIE